MTHTVNCLLQKNLMDVLFAKLLYHTREKKSRIKKIENLLHFFIHSRFPTGGSVVHNLSLTWTPVSNSTQTEIPVSSPMAIPFTSQGAFGFKIGQSPFHEINQPTSYWKKNENITIISIFIPLILLKESFPVLW